MSAASASQRLSRLPNTWLPASSDRLQIGVRFRHRCKLLIEFNGPAKVLTGLIQTAELRGVAGKVELYDSAVREFFGGLEKNFICEKQPPSASSRIGQGDRPTRLSGFHFQ